MKKLIGAIVLAISFAWFFMRSIWGRMKEGRAIDFCRKASYTGGVTAVGADLVNAATPQAMPIAAGYTLTEILGVVGATVAVLGFMFGQFWAMRKDRREAEESRAKLRRLARETGRVPLDIDPANDDDRERRA